MTATIDETQHDTTRRSPSMRRYLAPTLIGLGAFLLVAAVLVRFYAYPKLAVAPIDLDSTTLLEASDATIFDTNPKVLKEIETDLSVVANTRGDVKASEEIGDGTLVWVSTTTVTSADGIDRSKSTERSTHDEVTGEAVDCCEDDNWVEVSFDTTPGEAPEVRRVPAERKGLIFKFPFDTEKKTYQMWDGDLGAATDATFEAEEDLDGVTVYKFVQEIPETKIGTRTVPASVFGLTGDAVEADSMYSVTRTMWVEPVTGAILDRSEAQRATYQYDGNTLTATAADVHFTDAQVQKNVDDVRSKATLLGLAHGALPIGAAVLGLLALAAGVLLQRRQTV